MIDKDMGSLSSIEDRRLALIRAAVEDRDVLKSAVAGVDAVLHLAWSFSEDPLTVLEHDLKGHIYLLEESASVITSYSIHYTKLYEYFTMAKETVMAGCSAAAHAAKAARVEVISSYPIRPYTGIMMELSKLVANGELDAEFVHGEGEHAQVSIALGASASGARAYTGSSGVGVTYAMEVYSPTAGGRYPLQMAIADRALDPPGDFGSSYNFV